MALFNFTPLHLPIKFDTKVLDKFYRQIITHVPRIATYEITLDLPSFTGGEVKHVSVTVPGVITEDIVYANTPDLGDIHLICARVTSVNTIELVFWNDHGAVDPPSTKVKIATIRR